MSGGSCRPVKFLQKGILFDSPFLANSTLVPPAEEEVPGLSSSPRRVLSLPGAVREDSQAQVPFTLQASRLEVVKGAVLEEGFSAYSADVFCRCLRVSTIRLYQGV